MMTGAILGGASVDQAAKLQSMQNNILPRCQINLTIYNAFIAFQVVIMFMINGKSLNKSSELDRQLEG